MIILIMGQATHCPVRCKAEDVPNENIVWQFCSQDGLGFGGEVN